MQKQWHGKGRTKGLIPSSHQKKNSKDVCSLCGSALSY
jgi:hypothetical protein